MMCRCSLVECVSVFIVSASFLIQILLMIAYPNRFGERRGSEKQERFLAWFRNKGGWIHPNIKLSFFPDLGNGFTTTNCPKSTDVAACVQKGEIILKIPSSLVITAESCLKSFQDLASDKLSTDILSSVQRFWSHPLQQQDALIALRLMVECSLGQASDYYPYLQLLPKELIPRLDTFSEQELELLQDPHLSALARESASTLQRFWKNFARKACKVLSQKAIRHISGEGRIVNNTCNSFKNFHRMHAIVGSHALILDDKKYLAPMADMMNHQDSPQSNSLFQDFHKQNSDGSIFVFADRDTLAGNPLFEQYGTLDNSLYLMVFGFVPTENRYHCAAMWSDCLPKLDDLDLRAIAESAYPSLLTISSICVFRNGLLLDDEMNDYLALVHLQSLDGPRRRCIEAHESSSYVSRYCFNYDESERALQQTIRRSAQCSLHRSKTSLKEDLDLLEQLQLQSPWPTRAILAVRFRVFEKQLLNDLAGEEHTTASRRYHNHL